MKAAREFVGEIAEHVSMPEVYFAIRNLLLDSDTRIEDFVAVVEQDSTLKLRVMQMARSDYFGIRRRCDNLYQAISLIGLVQLHDLLLGLVCLRCFAGIPREVLNLEAFWRYNVQCGIAARTIGQYSKSEGHYVFFTLGLLHEIGHAALFLKAPEAALSAMDLSQSQPCELAEAEREKLGFDYCDVGAEMMRIWHLPPAYQAVAQHHLQPQAADEAFRFAVEVVHMAHAMCQEDGEDRLGEVIARGIDEVPQFKSLPINLGEIVAEQIATHCDAVLQLLWPREPRAAVLAFGGRLDA